MSDRSSKTAGGNALTRRHVFVGAGGAGALAVVASVLPGKAPEVAATVADAGAPTAEPTGYRLTEHIQRYYQTARV